jgi:hypothetical protein
MLFYNDVGLKDWEAKKIGLVRANVVWKCKISVSQG